MAKFGINGPRFARNFVFAWVTPRVHRVCERIGAENLTFLMDNNRSMAWYVAGRPKEEREVLEALMEVAPRFAWASDAITDDDFYLMLPDWLRLAVETRGERGQVADGGVGEADHHLRAARDDDGPRQVQQLAHARAGDDRGDGEGVHQRG